MKKIIVFLFLNLIFYSLVYSQINNEQFDVVARAKNKIYQYYGKKTFEEPEWIRVKNFLTWLDENQTSLNKYFAEKYPNISDDTEKLIFAFLGTNYLSQQLIGKRFDLPIELSEGRCYADPVHICIKPYNDMELFNVAIHEAAHILPYINNQNTKTDETLSEEITIFAQLKYALPLKSGKTVHGTKAFFIYSNEKEKQKTNDIKGDYADIVYSATNYSNYDENKILNTKIRKPYSVYKILELIFNNIDDNYLGNHILNEDEIHYLQSPVFQDTKKEMESRIFPNISEYNYSKGYLQKIFSDNEDEILFSFVRNLRKYADKNIPPVPEGYI